MSAEAAEAVVALLTARGLTVATAESLTGGLLCGAHTDVPGASTVVRGAVVAYATHVKQAVLGVSADLLAGPGGAVQGDVAAQMAEGVCRVVGSDVGVATTGVAGPEPQDGQPVGTVFVAVAVGGPAEVSQLWLDGTRSEIRAATVAKALALLLERLAAVEDRGDPGR
ncbi:MAG TPA: nicotinamide-nucleotide amidohydrolase family protein [Pedococcus sp.]